MLNLNDLNLKANESKVFEYFEEISLIPRGSGNMVKIAAYCENFAQKFALQYKRDKKDNVVIFKKGTKGFENSEPIILQGHLDIVCQCTPEHKIDFLTDGLTLLRNGNFIEAKGTTLGADNGIAVAYILTILASNDIPHPPIEAVFTTDEEIGLLGANALDTSILKAQKMINLDSETDDVLTVSCAGGQDVVLKLPLCREQKNGYKITVGIKGLLGGHSGVEIDKNRTNANILMGKFLNSLKEAQEFSVISINGGNKSNAIPSSCVAEICCQDTQKVLNFAKDFENSSARDIINNEPDFSFKAEIQELGEYLCLGRNDTQKAICLLNDSPNGVIKMSEEIDGLVETSLNLGILSCDENTLTAHFALRSNKENKLRELTQQISSLGNTLEAQTNVFGFYPPWEYKENSPLRELYKRCYKEQTGTDIKVEAIHAGLECAVFSSTIKDLDCISVGPNMFDVHTPNERLDIKSTICTFNLLLKVLAESQNL